MTMLSNDYGIFFVRSHCRYVHRKCAVVLQEKGSGKSLPVCNVVHTTFESVTAASNTFLVLGFANHHNSGLGVRGLGHPCQPTKFILERRPYQATKFSCFRRREDLENQWTLSKKTLIPMLAANGSITINNQTIEIALLNQSGCLPYPLPGWTTECWDVGRKRRAGLWNRWHFCWPSHSVATANQTGHMIPWVKCPPPMAALEEIDPSWESHYYLYSIRLMYCRRRRHHRLDESTSHASCVYSFLVAKR